MAAGAIATAALAVFASGLFDDPFVDEYAYITQSYYSDLYFDGLTNDPAWLEAFAFDLQPLPKYLIGRAFHAAGLPMPGPRVAALWYRNAHTRFGPPRALTIARLPFIAAGVLACLAIYAFGVQLGGVGTGVLAAALLALNPLFRLHAHRAMSEIPCEAAMIAGLALALWAVRRIWTGRDLATGLAIFALAGAASGVSIVCKLNGVLGPTIAAGWCVLALFVPAPVPRRKAAIVAGGLLAVATMATTMGVFNPTLTCRPTSPLRPDLAEHAAQGPIGRFREMIQFRFETTAVQQKIPKFFRDVVKDPRDKAGVFAVQGFGRFGLFGPSHSNSEIRYDAAQDWGLLVWWPMILLGIVATLLQGRRQLRVGEPPTAFALLVWAAVSWTVVAVYLPLAWDRYFMPIQAPNAMLAAVGLASIAARWRRKAVDA